MFKPDLRAHRGRLTSKGGTGQEVHAASFPRQRLIVLDEELLRAPREMARILAHEVFHFVWLRLANRTRCEYEALLTCELHRHARGELGWSAEWRKQGLGEHDLERRTKQWREYVCESFCDTAAWMHLKRTHSEFTLAPRWRNARKAWWQEAIGEQVRV